MNKRRERERESEDKRVEIILNYTYFGYLFERCRIFIVYTNNTRRGLMDNVKKKKNVFSSSLYRAYFDFILPNKAELSKIVSFT